MDVRLEDGTVVKNVPEGTTQDELMSRLSAGGYRPKGSSNLLDTFDSIDRQQGSAPQPEQPQASGRLAPNADFEGAAKQLGTAALRAMFPGAALVNDVVNATPEEAQRNRYVGEQTKLGLSYGLGMPVDAVNNLLNLGIAGYGVAKHALTGSNDLPALNADPFLGSGTFQRLFGYDPTVQPTSKTNQVVGRVARDLSAAAVPVAGMAGRPAAFLPRNPSVPALLQAEVASPVSPLLAGTGLQVASSAGGELARQAVPEPYKEAADMAGQLVGGVAVPSYVAARVQGYDALRKAGSQENANRLATGYVENKLREDVKNYPGARERLEEAIALGDEMGFQPRIGQGSGVPSIGDMERRVAISSPENFNRRAQQDEAQRTAILRQAEETLPLLRENDIPQRLAATQTERQALADALPQVSGEDVGQTLRAARSSMKGRYDQIAAEKFGAPAKMAEEQRVMVNPKPIIDRVDELMSNPALQYDANNLPAIAQRIRGTVLRDTPGEQPKLVNAEGRPLYEPRDRVFNIPYRDLTAMRSEVGKDIAKELTSPTPNARQRLRSLYEIQNTIDDVATGPQVPKEIADAHAAARDWYRTDYAPKFLRGINLKQSLRDVTGELRIPDEKLGPQYFKKMESTPTSRFVTLYGDNPTAMHAMEDHVLDTYRREVVKDGVIDPAKHEKFLANYGPALKQLPSMKDHLDSMGNAARLLAAREEQLAGAHRLLSQGQLEKLRYDNPDGTLGIDPRKVNNFLQKNGQALHDAIASVESPKVADEHIQNLQKIAKAAEIAERGSLGANAQPQQSTNPADMRGKLGFTGRTVFSMWRAVTTGRTSTEDVAYTLGAQHVSHRIRMAMIAAEERAIQDPETARLIAKSIDQPITSEAGKVTLRNILAKGGLYFVGANNYERTGKYQAAPFAIRATEKGKEAADQ